MRGYPSIYKDEVGEVFLEFNPDLGYLIHCDINVWTLAAYKHCKKVWKIMMDQLSGKPLYAALTPGDEKLFKFVTKFGFEKTSICIYNADGEFKKVMKWVGQ